MPWGDSMAPAASQQTKRKRYSPPPAATVSTKRSKNGQGDDLSWRDFSHHQMSALFDTGSLPSPLPGFSRRDMIDLIGATHCELCSRPPPPSKTLPNSPWTHGPGQHDIRIVWPLGLRLCGPCVLSQIVKVGCSFTHSLSLFLSSRSLDALSLLTTQ